MYALNQDVPLISMYSHQKQDIGRTDFESRNRYHNVFLIGRTEGLRALVKQFRKSSAPFLYLPDQDFGRNNSVFVDFSAFRRQRLPA